MAGWMLLRAAYSTCLPSSRATVLIEMGWLFAGYGFSCSPRTGRPDTWDRVAALYGVRISHARISILTSPRNMGVCIPVVGHPSPSLHPPSQRGARSDVVSHLSVRACVRAGKRAAPLPTYPRPASASAPLPSGGRATCVCVVIAAGEAKSGSRQVRQGAWWCRCAAGEIQRARVAWCARRQVR